VNVYSLITKEHSTLAYVGLVRSNAACFLHPVFACLDFVFQMNTSNACFATDIVLCNSILGKKCKWTEITDIVNFFVNELVWVNRLF